ncbi:hypothetical protein ABIC86_000376 [Paenibacillus sp. DS2363]|uniref:hypothetical protein n=1 Tax=Paenibacillus TaxID=44249 RepID=UPI00209E0474|nr:hypothetical protein [Paenibacillus xylanexedens]MCP1427472.1 hypothetical protein [Paenibacillus xylanexedens]
MNKRAAGVKAVTLADIEELGGLNFLKSCERAERRNLPSIARKTALHPEERSETKAVGHPEWLATDAPTSFFEDEKARRFLVLHVSQERMDGRKT